MAPVPVLGVGDGPWGGPMTPAIPGYGPRPLYAYPPGFGPRYPDGYGVAFVPQPVLPPVSDAVLEIPLGTRELIRQALDLLTRPDSGLRGASFYIGFLLLVTAGPLAVLVGLALTTGAFEADSAPGEFPAWIGWLMLAMIPAVLGYVAAQAESTALATAVIGGRVEGRPLRLRESIAVARRRFWSVLGPRLLANIISTMVGFIAGIVILTVLGLLATSALEFVVSLLVSLVVYLPLVYLSSGVVLGEVPAWEAVKRSVRLVRVRKRLAIVIALFGIFSQFIVGFGLSLGVDVIARVLAGAGVVDNVPAVLVVPIAAALAFAIGTLTFLVEAIAVAPAVHAFAGLTHYTHGLEVGRVQPVAGRHLWDPWMTPGLALTALLALVSMVGGVLSLQV